MTDIATIKAEAVRLWLGRNGVVGIGIGGPNQINVYVLSEVDAAKVPREFMGADVKVIVTGPIVAAGDAS